MDKSRWSSLAQSAGLLLALIVVPLLGAGLTSRASGAVEAGSVGLAEWTVVVDDFEPQPLKDEATWDYNRLQGNRGQIDGWWDPSCPCARAGGGELAWGSGSVKATITQAQGSEAWAGVWSSLSHEAGDDEALDFSAVFPAQILPAFQGRVTGLHLDILDGQGELQVELQAADESLIWSQTVTLTGGAQTVSFDRLPSGEVHNLNWIVKGAPGDFVEVGQVTLRIAAPELTTPERAFLWSYGMLLANWSPASGLTRDRASFPAGSFDNVSASALQAAAAVQAWHLGIISQASAQQIVSQTTAALIALPQCHGLWPHFVAGGAIAEGTEFSSVDTVVAMLALLEANQALGLEANADAVKQLWQQIAWSRLLTADGRIGHGFNTSCTSPLEHSWHDFGSESWLVGFGYAAATGALAEMDTTPPTHNGNGFIDELAWLFLPVPAEDRWGIRWHEYRRAAAAAQIAYYRQRGHPCYAPDLFGLSAAEVPDRSAVPPADIYQAFGVGGEIPANDGTDLLGHAVITPHYPAMIAALRPSEATAFWRWLEDQGLFSPLTNVESLMVTDEGTCQDITWNGLKGSWNLGLQTIGWGNYLLRDNNPLYGATRSDDFLRQGYVGVTCPGQCELYLPLLIQPEA